MHDVGLRQFRMQLLLWLWDVAASRLAPPSAEEALQHLQRWATLSGRVEVFESQKRALVSLVEALVCRQTSPRTGDLRPQ